MRFLEGCILLVLGAGIGAVLGFYIGVVCCCEALRREAEKRG